MTIAEGTDLGNKILLSKIDRLRETNVGTIIPLPQVRYVQDSHVSLFNFDTQYSSL